MTTSEDIHVFPLTFAVASLALGIIVYGLGHFFPSDVLKAVCEVALYLFLTSATLAFSYLLFVYSSREPTGESAQARR